MAKVKYRIREYTPKENMPGTHGYYAQAVIDPFMGSGTTAIACIKERRHFIGFELNKEYYNKALKRIEAEKSQLSLF